MHFLTKTLLVTLCKDLQTRLKYERLTSHKVCDKNEGTSNMFFLNPDHLRAKCMY